MINKQYTRQSFVDSHTYSHLEIGSRIEIRYQTDNPSNSLPLSQINTVLGDARNKSLTGIFMVFAILFAFYLAYIRNSRLITLARNGKIIVGTVVNASGKSDEDGFVVILTYKYRNPDGIEAENKASNTRNDLYHEPLPKPGTKLAILYINDKLLEVL